MSGETAILLNLNTGANVLFANKRCRIENEKFDSPLEIHCPEIVCCRCPHPFTKLINILAVKCGPVVIESGSWVKSKCIPSIASPHPLLFLKKVEKVYIKRFKKMEMKKEHLSHRCYEKGKNEK